MKQGKAARAKGIGALELIEEATALLRGAPVEVLARYYLGTLPFALGALYFWADMSRNADADARLAGSSLALALLFIWMKYWQARFCGELSRRLLNDTALPTASGTALTQAIIQPWSFLVMPLALLVTLPVGWCFAYFQNVTVIGAGFDLRRLSRTARQQAMLWPGQNHILLGVFLLLGLVVFANLCLGAFFLPRMLKTLFGVESVFTRSNFHLLNSTFWVAMAALTHLCVDPLVKAAYLLRCHYGASLASGADLLAELQEARRAAGLGLALLLLSTALFLAAVPPARAAAAAPGQPAPRPVVTVQQLDKTIEQVIAGPEFAWRLPRPAQQREEMPGFIRSAQKLVKEWVVTLGDWLKRFVEWLAEILPKFKPKEDGAFKGFGFPDYAFPLLYGLLAAILAGGAVFFWRQARRGRETAAIAPPPTLVMTPDVADENVTADELTEERWHALARELLAKGELRLGLRALYLAGLACLAQERLIAIARFKSNHDYERELGRFAHALPEVAIAFSRNVALFEQAWYGMHRLEQGMVTTFISNHERIVSGVRQG